MRTFTLSAAIAAALLLAGASARAADTKIYPGTWCVQTVPPIAGDNSTWIQGSFMNTQATTNSVYYCPIIKTVADNPTLESVSVTVSTPANGSVQCAIKRFDLDLKTSDYATVAQTVSGSNKTMTFTNVASGQVVPWSTNAWYAYQLYCQFSQTAGTVGTIQRYTVREAGNADTAHKIYPNTTCKEQVTPVPAGAAFYHDDQRLQWTVHNSSRLSVTCPVISDHMGNTAATALAQIAIGRPFPSNPNVNCDFYALGSYGTLYDSKSASVAPGDEYDIQRVDLDLAKSSSWGRYQITCTAGSGDPKILSYRVQEN